MARHNNDTSTVKRIQLPDVGYHYLTQNLDSVDDRALVMLLRRQRRNGRPGYHPRAMLRAWLAKYKLNIRYNTQLVEKLKLDSDLRKVCGFGDDTPSESTFTYFTKRLTEYPILVAKCFAQLVDDVHEIQPDLGDKVAIDSTVIESNSNPNRNKTFTDPDAKWGRKHSAKTKPKRGEKGKRGETKTEWAFGYSLHTICDAKYEIPLGMVMTSANQHDSPLLPTVMEKVKDTFDWFNPKHVIGDKGYDSRANHEWLIDRNITPVIAIRKPTAGDGMYDGIFNEKGEPTCMGGVGMEYVKTDAKTGKHLYRCPVEGCELKQKGTKAITHCDTEYWVDPGENPRVAGPLPRESEEWTEIYKMRQSVERLFKNTKHDRLLEGHLYRTFGKIWLHAMMSLITYTATILTRLRRGDRKVIKLRVKLAA